MERILFVTGNKTYSSWSMRAWLALKHTGADFEEVLVPLFVSGFKEKLLQYSPTGKVPLLRVGDQAIWDSLAICEYLAERFPDARLWPEESAARALARCVSAEMHSGFPVIRHDYPFNCRAHGRQVPRTTELNAEITRVERLWTDCQERYGRNGPWLFGRFTVADCMYIPVALRFVTYGTELGRAAADYIRTVQQHPAVGEWVAAAQREQEVVEASEVGQAR